MSRGPDYSRSRARDEAIRAQLEPLAPGERPLGLKLAIALVIVVTVANTVAAVAAGAIVYTIVSTWVAIVLVAGLWERNYYVILIVQALLGLGIAVGALSLLFVGNLRAVLLAVGVVAVCAPVFWLLVRVMARLQVPPR